MDFRPDVCIWSHSSTSRAAVDGHNVLDASGARLPDWSPADALRFMIRFGIQSQVVSLPEPGLAFLPDLAARIAMAAQLNDYLHEALVHAAPGTLEHGRLAPLMQTLNALKARVMVIPVAPPVAPPDQSGLPIPDAVLELPFETTRVATNLLYKLAYLLYPDICWQFSEGGGATPYLSFRSGLLALNLNPNVSSYARLHFDTATASAPATVASMRAVTDLSHILLGTDFPYSGITYALKLAGDPNAELNQSFNALERQLIDRGNALAQLPGLAARLTGS